MKRGWKNADGAGIRPFPAESSGSSRSGEPEAIKGIVMCVRVCVESSRTKYKLFFLMNG
jgi:hypothetical protein